MKIPAVAQPHWPAMWQEAWAYDRLEFGGDTRQPGYTLAYRNRFAVTLELVRRAAAPPARVLDVAAAQGNFALALAEAGYAVTWNDLRSELAGYVGLKHERGELVFQPGNVFELDVPAPFDIVLATEVIEHVAHPDRFLAQLGALVRTGGHAVLTTPNGGYFRNRLPRFSDCADPSAFEERQFGPGGADHIFLLHEDELRRMAPAAGWRVRELRLHTSFLLSGHCRTEPLLRAMPAEVIHGADAMAQRLPRAWRRRVDVGIAILLRRVA
jgi:2-polyprenyl-6-hydroxyphenyl methylase/3-demethylubiquinone-9 3-methyltransferase